MDTFLVGRGAAIAALGLLVVTRQTRTTENDRPRHDVSSYFLDTTPVNSLESLGFLSVFKAYHQIVSVPEDNDDREVRISFSK